MSTDPAYPPQSQLNKDTNEYEGFDIDVANEIAKRLGVKTAWEAPSWDVITAGGWNGRWDMSVGSMTVTEERAKVLNFTPAYYYTPASIAVHKDNTTINDLTTDLDGKKIGVCSSCTYEAYLKKTLDDPGLHLRLRRRGRPRSPATTPTRTAIQDLALGDGDRLDAAMSSLTTLQGAIDEGAPIKLVGDPLFYEPLAVAFDKKADSDSASRAVSKIVEEMHDDGTLTEMSKKWYDGTDYTVADSSAAIGETGAEPVTDHRRPARVGRYERLQLRERPDPVPVKVAAGVAGHLRRSSSRSSRWRTSTRRGCVDNARFVLGGLKYTLLLAVAAIVLACILALIGALCRISNEPGRCTGCPASTPRSSAGRRSSCSCS